jgi:hypothetical protein
MMDGFYWAMLGMGYSLIASLINQMSYQDEHLEQSKGNNTLQQGKESQWKR